MEHKEGPEVFARICDFATKNNYVMPIIKFILTNQIPLKEIQRQFPRFFAPQMYYNLDEKSELLAFIEGKIQVSGDEICNVFSCDIRDRICEKMT